MTSFKQIISSTVIIASLSWCNQTLGETEQKLSVHLISTTEEKIEKIIVKPWYIINGVEAQKWDSIKCNNFLCELEDKTWRTITGWINTNEWI